MQPGEVTADLFYFSLSHSPPLRCSINTCGRYYHIECIRRYPITFFYERSIRFRCALHYCAGCAIPGDSQSMIRKEHRAHTDSQRHRSVQRSYLLCVRCVWPP